MSQRYSLHIWRDEEEITLQVPAGANLRDVLLTHDLSPYSRWTEDLNCGGRGLCATCGVWVDEGPQPDHWHDQMAQRFGYPRLACQITVDRDMALRLATEKLVWGGRRPVALGTAERAAAD